MATNAIFNCGLTPLHMADMPIGNLFVSESVKFYIKLRHSVYVDTLWNTPTCQVIIICLTAKSKQCFVRIIS